MDVINPTSLFVLAACIFCVALLYSSVGHGGASGYIAIMAIFSFSPAILKPAALMLNILVSAIATVCFVHAGHFSWKRFWPFAVTSIPCSYLGGYISLPPHLYRPLVGIVLLFSAYYLFTGKKQGHETEMPRQPLPLVALLIGGILGLLSGLTGVGGGIFLSPLLLMFNWAKPREASAVAALFIMVNSTAGLAGHLSNLQTIPTIVPFIAIAAILGGVTGSMLGSRYLTTSLIVKALSVVLTIAGAKLLFL